MIGGGSGGIACAKQAGLLLGPGKTVLFDYVQPTPIGTQWGVGGTCVNVGCIPKKLMHTAARYGHIIKDSHDYGWTKGISYEELKNDWETLQTNVGYHIRSINWGYKRSNLPEHNVKLETKYARFVDAHTLETEDAKGNKAKVTANKIVIACGGRPRYPDIPGAKVTLFFGFFCCCSVYLFLRNLESPAMTFSGVLSLQERPLWSEHPTLPWNAPGSFVILVLM